MNENIQPGKLAILHEAIDYLAKALEIMGVKSLHITADKTRVSFEGDCETMNRIALIEFRDTMKPLPYLVDVDNRPAFSFDANPPHMAYPEYHD